MIEKFVPWLIQHTVIISYAMLLLSWATSVRADDSEILKRRFFEEAPHAWEVYKSYVTNLQGSTETTIFINDKLYSKSHVEFKRNQHCALVLSQSLLEGNTQGDVVAFNSYYGFELKRTTSESSWVLGDLKIGKIRVGAKGWEKFPALNVCISTQSCEFAELIQLPNFQVVHAQAMKRDGLDVCLIHFKCVDMEGDLILDPARFWTLRESNISDKSSKEEIVAKQVVEIIDPAAKYPIPKHWLFNKRITDPKNGKSESRVTREFNLREANPPPEDDEFTLSAFGLPEPKGTQAPEHSSRTWLWLLGAAVVAVALAILFAWLKRRHAFKSALNNSGSSPRSLS